MQLFIQKILLIFKSWRTLYQRLFPVPPEVNEHDMPYMSSVSEALVEQTPHAPQRLFRIIFILFTVLILWASFAKVDEFTLGFGKVVPSKSIQVIQNLEGGILSEILVHEGQLVEKGQSLIRIDDTRFSSTMKENDLQLDFLNVKVQRLKAESTGTDFFLPQSEENLYYQREMALYRSRQFEYENEKLLIADKVIQKKLQLDELKNLLINQQRSEKLVRQEFNLTKPLVIQGAVSPVEVLRLEREMIDLQGNIKSTKITIPRLEAELHEVNTTLERVSISFKTKAHTELNEVQATLAQMQEGSQALGDRVARTLVVAPVKGTIKQLKVTTIGGVIQPGMDLVEIVPYEDQMMVEVKIRPADIAFIHPEQPATVKVTAYDFSIHGGLKGKVVHISPDTIIDEQGDSYYLVKIITYSNFNRQEDSDHRRPELPIIPGMTVEAGILTGEKTIMSYLLKPILKTKNNALRER
jgi:adhesin transport system membrane fusion protein